MPVRIGFLFRLLALLALTLAPLGMLGSHQAVAMGASHTAAAESHCMEMGEEGQSAPDKAAPATAVDCAIVCSCIPAVATPMPRPQTVAAILPSVRIFVTNAGLDPEAEPRPPRNP
ncbi:hypothetical protein [Allosphingosinicella sp.]|jgi:hypothetical protein|uniref:hypothetical protein n=1 Tax=Allosphingosinicella sp. TaxID=2823234 RepID=UPI003D726EC3